MTTKGRGHCPNEGVEVEESELNAQVYATEHAYNMKYTRGGH